MKVCVIGGGAAGMMAAITAADCGHSVLLLERQARVGRKLMATGNGRCNLTNRNAAPQHYHGENRDFCAYALAAFDADAALAWFSEHGLVTVTEESGRVYPYSNMAGSVLDVLRYALERPDIDLHAGCVVTRVRRRGEGFTVETEQGSFAADKVILCAGGAAGSKVGGVMDGYQLGKALGHHRTALYPSLVQLKTDPTYPRALKGVKAEANVRILRGHEVLAENRGEILFTEYGVSGPAVFEISRAAAVGGDGLTVELDFLPDWNDDATMDWLQQRRRDAAGREAGTLLAGTLHSRLGQMVCKAAGFTGQSADTLTDRDLAKIARRLRGFTLEVQGVCGFDQAQVTAGGLRTDEFDPETMESRLVPGFYACGEVLDIDGDCGGYNLQWAWSSGHLAGLCL
ncbi:MAG: aminoacetone oxidase family FAD-binding enzyme [Ruminococcaceae bacterium]|nr:aminoacetone oxidase family FAD-binding enzyme [Oscillospiraceae bacterium]